MLEISIFLQKKVIVEGKNHRGLIIISVTFYGTNTSTSLEKVMDDVILVQ